ncbi:MAG: ribosomal protein L25/ral stress protein Ctc [Bacteroidetes bacterium]|jgi:large subunit ribosomal protein L25|nr:ribosomal protein L25/ral stress protein Ctc [Bacteroidota bacterium]MDF2452335.1 ribosomal protein L25/ral stress protein Ctc [Bacteroidota bacterium]
MKSVTLSGSLRTNVGKVNAKAVREKGNVPCVIYGGKEQIHFEADIRAFKPVIFTPNAHIVEIDLDGKVYKTVLQEAQYHKINDKLIHADFLEIQDGKPVTANIPVVITGQSEGVKKGGKLVLKMRKLKVRGIAHKLPDAIEIDITKLDIGDSVAAGDITVEGATLLNAKNVSVVSVTTTRAVAAAETNAAPAKK